MRAAHRRPSCFSGEGQLLPLACLLGEGVIHQTVEVHPFLLLQLSGGGHHRLQPLQRRLLHHRCQVPCIDLPVPGADPFQNRQIRIRELSADGLRHLPVRMLRHPALSTGDGVGEALHRTGVGCQVAAVGEIGGVGDLAALLTDGAENVSLARLLHLRGSNSVT